MPGTNLLASSDELTEQSQEVFYELQRALLHRPAFAQQTFVATSNVLIGMTAYRHYPCQQIEMADATAILEGVIYNKGIEVLRDLLRGVASSSHEDNDALHRHVASFVADADGEFLVVLHDRRSRRIILFNDVLGRLPFYYATEGSLLIASREPKFIVPLLRSFDFNREALMQYLLYGFPFGETTLVDGIRQLAAGTIATFDCKTGTFSRSACESYDVESNSRTTRATAVEMMKEYFISGLARRAERLSGHTAVVSLSGGLDSRAMLAGLAGVSRDLHCVTMDTAEAPTAQQCAEVFHVPCTTVPGFADAASLLPHRGVFLSDAMDSHPRQESLHHFLDYICQIFAAPLVYCTGYFGGELTRYAHLARGVPNVDALVRYLLRADDAYKYDTNRVTSMLGIDRESACQSLFRHLSSFPDGSPYSRYVRFRYEFDRHFIGHGEDRSRFYFWTITGFSSLELFRFLVSLDSSIKDTRLFRDFLLAIDPKTCSVKNYTYSLSLQSAVSLWLLGLIEAAAKRRIVKSALRPFWRMYRARLFPYASARVARQQVVVGLLHTVECAQDYFCLDRCREVLRNEADDDGLARMTILLRHMKFMTEWRARFGMSNKIRISSVRSHTAILG